MTKHAEYVQLFAEQGYITKQQANSLLTLKQMQDHIKQHDPSTYEVIKDKGLFKVKQELVKWVDMGRGERLNQKMANRQGMKMLP